MEKFRGGGTLEKKEPGRGNMETGEENF